ncbi:MAG: type II toxin-antitoxin system prevent-host-death family antitoxin [Desulfovibrionaceae bacterium]|nr:type II toxin-antitoxin system prevent-host-death family antitoxin [Desulfovibrionaceae bacterium]
MNTISYTEARQNLAATMDSVVNGRDIVIITRQKAAPVVMMSLEDFNSMRETMYLLGNPANAEHLRKGIADIASGNTTRVTLDELSAL